MAIFKTRLRQISKSNGKVILANDYNSSEKNLQNKTIENIKKLNSDYEAKRNKNLALEPPILNVVPTGYFYNWMKEKNRLGRQFKIARLHNNREFVDSMFKNQTLSLKSYKFN